VKGDKIEEVKKLQKDFEVKKAKSKASFVVDKIEGSKYFIKSLEGKTFEVSLVTIGEGKAELQGLPNKLGTYLVNYTEQDIYESTADVIDCLITMYDAKGDGQANIVEQMPTEE
jgi:hypothetical protein